MKLRQDFLLRDKLSREAPKADQGWKEQVEPFQTDARFWYSIWRSAGRPNTVIYTTKAATKNMYHYAIRRARKAADLAKAKKLFEA